jgi:TIR domain
VPEGPPYLTDLSHYVETRLEQPDALLAALAALLADPASYQTVKHQPSGTLSEFVEQLVLTNGSVLAMIGDEENPVSRVLINRKWCPVWKNARSSTEEKLYKYRVCISFSGTDRPIAEKIATYLKADGVTVFYDNFEKNRLWGSDLAEYLYDIYAHQCWYCLILFSYAYRERAWTRHELRAAQVRALRERASYVLPVALNEGAIPDEFSGRAYWTFSPGDERQIADATKEKINEYFGLHYLTLEEVKERLTGSVVPDAVVDGFRDAIRQRIAAGDTRGAEIFAILALIFAADSSQLLPAVRALVNLVLFAPGPVSEIFVDDEVEVLGAARVFRSLVREEPLLLTSEWFNHIQPYVDRWNAGDSAEEENDSETLS